MGNRLRSVKHAHNRTHDKEGERIKGALSQRGKRLALGGGEEGGHVPDIRKNQKPGKHRRECKLTNDGGRKISDFTFVRETG